MISNCYRNEHNYITTYAHTSYTSYTSYTYIHTHKPGHKHTHHTQHTHTSYNTHSLIIHHTLTHTHTHHTHTHIHTPYTTHTYTHHTHTYTRHTTHIHTQIHTDILMKHLVSGFIYMMMVQQGRHRGRSIKRAMLHAPRPTSEVPTPQQYFTLLIVLIESSPRNTVCCANISAKAFNCHISLQYRSI